MIINPYVFATGGGAASSVTWNPLDADLNLAFTESNKRMTKVNSDGWVSGRATASHDASDASGYYFELEVVAIGGSPEGIFIGVGTSAMATNNFVGAGATSFSYYGNGQKFTSGSGAAYGAAYTTGDIIGVFLRDGKLWFRKNGAWIGDPDADSGAAFTGLSGTFFPAGSCHYNVGGSSLRCYPRSGSLPTGGLDW